MVVNPFPSTAVEIEPGASISHVCQHTFCFELCDLPPLSMVISILLSTAGYKVNPQNAAMVISILFSTAGYKVNPQNSAIVISILLSTAEYKVNPQTAVQT